MKARLCFLFLSLQMLADYRHLQLKGSSIHNARMLPFFLVPIFKFRSMCSVFGRCCGWLYLPFGKFAVAQVTVISTYNISKSRFSHICTLKKQDNLFSIGLNYD